MRKISFDLREFIEQSLARLTHDEFFDAIRNRLNKKDVTKLDILLQMDDLDGATYFIQEKLGSIYHKINDVYINESENAIIVLYDLYIGDNKVEDIN